MHSLSLLYLLVFGLLGRGASSDEINVGEGPSTDVKQWDGPPPGFEYEGPPRPGDRGPVMIGIPVMCTALAMLFVALRMWRTRQIKTFRWDDGFILVSLFFFVANTAVIIAAVMFGVGKHLEAIFDRHEQLWAVRLSIISQTGGTIALLFAKISVGVTLLQLRLDRKFNILIIISTAFTACANLLWGIAIMIGCRGRYIWYTGDDLPCAPLVLYPLSTYLRAVSNILLDVIFFAAPIYFLRKIKINARDRLAIHILLSFLLIASFFAIASASIIRKLQSSGIDRTWNTVIPLCLQSAEVGISIMAASLPAIRQMFGKRFPKHWRFWHSSFGAASSGAGTHSTSGHDLPAARTVTKTTTISSTHAVSGAEPKLHSGGVRFPPPHRAQSAGSESVPDERPRRFSLFPARQRADAGTGGAVAAVRAKHVPLSAMMDVERQAVGGSGYGVDVERGLGVGTPEPEILGRLSGPFKPVSPRELQFKRRVLEEDERPFVGGGVQTSPESMRSGSVGQGGSAVEADSREKREAVEGVIEEEEGRTFWSGSSKSSLWGDGR